MTRVTEKTIALATTTHANIEMMCPDGPLTSYTLLLVSIVARSTIGKAAESYAGSK